MRLKADWDGDGSLDIFVVNYGQPNQLFLGNRNAHDGFVEVSSGPAVSGSQYSIAAVAARQALPSLDLQYFKKYYLRTCASPVRLAPVFQRSREHVAGVWSAQMWC